VYWTRGGGAAANAANLAAALEAAKGKPALEYHPMASVGTQVYYVFSRTFFELARSPNVMPIRLTMVLFLALLYGMIWFNLTIVTNGLPNYSGIQSLVGFITAGPLFCAMVMYLTIARSINDMRAVYYRERAAFAFAPWIHSSSLFVVDVPYLIVFALIFTAISYFMVGLYNDAGTYFVRRPAALHAARAPSAAAPARARPALTPAPRDRPSRARRCLRWGSWC
jgi:hypothetical protein